MIRLANWYFLLLIPLAIYLVMRKRKHALKFSSVGMLKESVRSKSLKHKIGKAGVALGVTLLIIALARPQIADDAAPIQGYGIDIAIVLDVSGSMQSVDFEPNRLKAAVDTIENFVRERPQDRIALIIFAGTAYTKIPLTLDHNIIRESLSEVSTESVNEDGTAIGMAISVGVNRLKKSDAASRIMLLVTDGDNNAGTINPATASELAKEMGIKIYTIGVGTDETIIPVQILGRVQYRRVEGGLNEELLKEIAQTTGGQYYRARDSKAMSDIFENINRLEKTEFNRDNFRQYTELAFIFIRIALVLLLLGIFLDRFYFIQIP